MGKIHYFQRYSSVENTVTNNTLQLISRIYQYSPVKASQLLTNLTDESIEIGLEITQQQREGDSVPDATILQRSFKILVESKVDSPVSKAQLLRHAKGFKNEDIKILLLLTKSSLPNAQADEIKSLIQKEYPSVIFKHITYEDICVNCEDLFQSHEYQMNELIDDYKEYCNDTHLFDQARYTMRVVPCGSSVSINLKYGVYFQPSDRGYSDHRYLGIYAKKKVQALWEVHSVIDVELKDEKLIKSYVHGEKTDEYDEKISKIIADAKTVCGYNIESGHRFFCGKQYPTNFRKVSSGGIMGARMFNLKQFTSSWDSAESLSRDLQTSTWE
ncbi:hypothetical protein L4D76_27430 [Photobacterium sagamiensis]|uniref:hypothetical protein n=1 Tax=Photobacterium sagamiensis TaxID=2910241 RepID=UPI003D0B2381